MNSASPNQSLASQLREYFIELISPKFLPQLLDPMPPLPPLSSIVSKVSVMQQAVIQALFDHCIGDPSLVRCLRAVRGDTLRRVVLKEIEEYAFNRQKLDKVRAIT